RQRPKGLARLCQTAFQGVQIQLEEVHSIACIELLTQLITLAAERDPLGDGSLKRVPVELKHECRWRCWRPEGQPGELVQQRITTEAPVTLPQAQVWPSSVCRRL